MTSARLAVLIFGFIIILHGQDPARTRAETIEADRRAKAAAAIEPSGSPFMNLAEKFVTRGFRIWNDLQAGTHGLSANIGGLSVGSQVAIGPEYIFRDGDYYQPRLIWHTYVVAAGDLSFRMQTGLELPRINHERNFFTINAYRYEYTQLQYFGPGNTSTFEGRSDYRQRESAFEFKGGFIIHRKFRAGLLGNYRDISIGPGSAPGIPTTESMYSNLDIPGLAKPSTFLTGGAFAEYEGRDLPADPHSGGYLSVRFQNVNGSRKSLGGFDQYDFDGQYYLPFWNRTRVVALRVRSSLTTPHAGSFVPFYLQPHLGGSDDLRGFDTYRFRDEDDIVASAEYRWTVIPLVDMVLFADAGKVYHNSDSLNLKNVMSDAGVGVRARTASTVPFRFDVGISREGVHLWLTLVNLF